MHRREFLKKAALLAGAIGGKWLLPGEMEAYGGKSRLRSWREKIPSARSIF